MKNNLARKLTGEPSLEARVVLEQITRSCLEVKAKDVVSLDLNGFSDISKYFLIASGRSDRQVQGIANRILEDLESLGLRPLHVEGYDSAHWVLLDFGEVVVHLFYDPLREHYDLEGLWSQAPKKCYLPEAAAE